ncbi:hypothetical protein VP01_2388g3 [Puccinia sorghi]|uniref:Uncharacterized protein n=1 Tax=Puccinia sorghi TaxID=27349 RepID=A0A0L6V8S3_9BASI|nr:hypothetical protein VP01_2388g3 [Puccinia sorghi]
MPPNNKSNQKKNPNPRKLPPCPRKQPLKPRNQIIRSQLSKERGHLKKEEYLVIIEWLKIKQNYNSCFGTGKAPAVGHPAKMKDLFNNYTYKYKKVHTKSIAMGFGLTNGDQKAVISTMDEKLESMCPHYHAMNELMGDQAFFNPWYKVNAQAENKTTSSSTSELAGNEIRSIEMESNNDYKATTKPTKPTTKNPAIGKKSKKNRGNNSSEDDSADKTSGHLKKEDYLVIIKWLKIQKNYNSCFGTWKAPAVGCPAKDQITGFEMMAINFHNQYPSKINLTPPQMKDLFNTVMVKV